jgi:hypothetical protein
MTLTQKIVNYVTSNPGKTATQVARGLSEGIGCGAPTVASVSGILWRLCKQRNGLFKMTRARGSTVGNKGSPEVTLLPRGFSISGIKQRLQEPRTGGIGKLVEGTGLKGLDALTGHSGDLVGFFLGGSGKAHVQDTLLGGVEGTH